MLTYDLNGNRKTRTVIGGSDNSTDTYSYDIENRLITMVKGTAGSSTAEEVAVVVVGVVALAVGGGAGGVDDVVRRLRAS